MWLQRERKNDVIWSDLKLGGHLVRNAILYQSLSKIRSNSKLPSIIVTNISRSPPHTTSWFTEVRHPHLKTNRQGLLSRVHILIVSKSNLKLQVFGLFWRFVRTLTIKISSSEEPANSTSIYRVRNGCYTLSSLSKKYYIKVSIAQLRIRGRALEILKWHALNKFYQRMRRRSNPQAVCGVIKKLMGSRLRRDGCNFCDKPSMLHLFLNTYTTTF